MIKRRMLAFLVIGLGFAGQASADGILISPDNCQAPGGNTLPDRDCWTTNVNSNPTPEFIGGLIGVDPADLEEQYKSDYEEGMALGDDGGPFDSAYDTTFSPSAEDPTDAIIAWNFSGGSIDCSSDCYLVVKDGNHEPAVYIFDISDWNGTEHIHMTGFWSEGGGSISHVSIYGGGTPVPEPGTLALLGLGLFGIGVMRRRQ